MPDATARPRSLDDLAIVIAKRLPSGFGRDRDSVFRGLAEHHLASEH